MTVTATSSTPARAQAPPAGEAQLPDSSIATSPNDRAAAGERAESSEVRIHVLFTTDIDGRFAWPGCRGPATVEHANLAHLIAAVERKRSELARAGEAAPLVLAGGNMIRPDIMGAHVFRKGGTMADTAVDLLRRVGFHGVAVGRYDFGAPATSLEAYLGRMQRAGIPLLAGNVHCADARDFRCRHLGGGDGKRYLVHERRGIRVGIAAITRRDVTQRIIQGRAGSMQAGDPLATARKLIRQLRERERASVVILLTSLNLEDDSPQPTIDFVRTLGDDAPDMVVADSMFDRDSGDFIARIQSRLGSAVVGTGRFGQSLGHAIIRLQRRRGGRPGDSRVRLIDVEVEPVRDASPDPVALSGTRALLQDLCRAVDVPVGRARLPRPLEHDQVARYLLELMRNEQGAEIALLNESALAPSRFAAGPLTREMVMRTIRSETRLGSVWITGARLQQLLLPFFQRYKSGLRWLGVTSSGGSWYINQRPLISGQHYRVATTQFVAEGGDGLIALGSERFRSSGRSLRRVVIGFFEADRQARRDGDPGLDLATDFADPSKMWVLYGSATVGVHASDLSVNNGPGGQRHSQPQLTREDLASLRLEADLSLGASNHDHALEVDVKLQYGRTWTRTWVEVEREIAPGVRDTATAKQTTPAESADQVRLDLLYRLDLLRNRLGAGRWYVPQPYAESTLLTEFTADNTYLEGDEQRTYRYLALNGVLGAGVMPHPLLFFKAGFSFGGELLTPARQLLDGQPLRTGVFLGYTLRRVKLLSSPSNPLQVESRIDFLMTNLGGSFRKELSLQSRLLFGITPYLHLSAGHQLYLLDTEGADASTANDVSLGLELLFDHRHQTY